MPQCLIDKIKHQIIFDEKLLPYLLDWLFVCSMSTARCMRHTAAELAPRGAVGA